MSGERVQHEAFYPHPPEKVWEALTRSGALSAWLMPNDFRPVVGRRFSFYASEEHGWKGIVECEVVEVTPPHRLAYTWRSDPALPATLVEWTLYPERDGTRLRLAHHRRDREERVPMPRFFRIQVDEVALAAELFAFVTDPSPRRTERPVVGELHDLNPEMIEVLESMVLDGVDDRRFVEEYVRAAVGAMAG